MTDEVKVGILFLLVAALAVGTGIYLTEAGARWGTYEIVAHFADTKGLQPGANVMMAGVNIGKVRSIELRPDPRFPDEPVRVTLSLRKDVPLHTTDRFVIDQGALLGDKFLTVQRPSAEELAAAQMTRGERLLPGDEVVGGPALGFANLSEQLQQLMAQASHSLEVLTATYASPEIKEGVARFLAQVNSASVHLSAITEGTLRLITSLNQVVESNRGAVSESLRNIAAASLEVRLATRSINEMIEGISTGPIPTQLLVTVTNIRKISEDVRGFLADPENQQRLESTLADVAATTADLRVVAANLKQVADDPQVEADIKGTLANLKTTTDNLREVSEATRQLMTSKENLEAIRVALANLREMTTQGVAVTQKASSALDRVDRTMDRLGQVAANFQPEMTAARLGVEATRGESTRTDLNADLRWSGDPDAFWRVGVRGVGTSETLNLQRSMRLGPRGTVRAGIFGSKPGMAMTYRVAPYSVWELEAWHPGENRLDLRTYWDLSGGWELTAGVVRLFSDNDPFVGLQRVIYSHRTSPPGERE